MVTLLSKEEQAAIEQAVAAAETRAGADIVVAIVHASDHYADFLLLYGLLSANFLALGLWISRVSTNFLELLTLQLVMLLALFFIPALRRLVVRAMPKRVLHQRSARRALEEYHSVYRQLPAAAPLVLLFISLGEHYAHILPSHAVHEKIPDEQWHDVITEFTKSISAAGLTQACVHAVGRIGGILAQALPANGASYGFSNQVIEKER